MNKLSGHISELKVNGGLTQVTVQLPSRETMRAIVIENPDTAGYLRKEHPVNLIFKETEVILSKAEQDLSLLNRLKGEVQHIRKGELLSEVGIRTGSGDIRAVISTDALEQLHLEVKDRVVAMIKQNEIMLGE